VKAIVVGAGFAGLAAADELRRAGAEVEVFEARDRVGGRVWSVPFAGATVERGAEFIFPDHETVIGMAERVGVRLVRKGTLYGDREPRGTDGVTREAVLEAVARIRSEPPPAHGTVVEALATYGFEPPVAEAIRARLEVSCAYPAADLDAEALVEGAGAFGSFESYGIEGGNSRLAQAIAEQLEAAVHLSTPVARISWSEREVRVGARGHEARADAAVIAVPAAVIDGIRFDPPLPSTMSTAMHSVRYGQAAKLFVALRAPAPPSATLSVPQRFWCYTQLGADGQPVPFVTAFAGSLQALESLAVSTTRWVKALARLRPDLELEPDSAMVSTWDADRWARGAYSASSVASPLDTDELRRPVGPLAFAGEHTAGAWHGLMEGALRSGVRAAQQMLSATCGDRAGRS
jgi:monoamine oxidase